MGLQLTIPGANFAALPVLRNDPVLSPGSLFMLDPTHGAGAWPAGVPANAALMPNIALKEALALIPGKTAAQLSGPVVNNGSLAGTKGKMERSGKGGMHGIVSPTNALTRSDAFTVQFPADIKAYMKANVNNRFYLSAWERVTRLPGVGSAFSILSANGTFGIGLTTSGSTHFGGTILNATVANVTGNRFVNVEAKPAATLATDPDTSPDNHLAYNIGNRGGDAASYGKTGSRILYRVYLEDLTVSGRTFAEVKALDQAEYTKHVLTAGGRYYGDTFTDPATIA